MIGPDCPYCGEPQEINHDDGYGYDENGIHHQQCGDCDKYFTFQTCIHFSYDLAQADCLNGGEHKFKASFTVPIEYTRMECVQCGEIRNPTTKEMADVHIYHNQLATEVAPPKEGKP